MELRKEELSVSHLVQMLSSQETAAPADRRPQVTEVIHVPTSEHVAQIVGKAGSKIKNLRALTNTCIKTPLRGDEPIFSVTGVLENVQKASQAIRFASEHFTKLMMSRSNTCAAGEVTIMVPVPQQYVGVVVGRNGSVVMRIKEQTNTRINTPQSGSGGAGAYAAAFEVTGSRVNVLAAKEAIEEKVRQAYQLRKSSIYDPNLNQKFLNTTIQMPSRPIPEPSTSSLNPFPRMPYAEALPMAPSVFDPNFQFMFEDIGV